MCRALPGSYTSFRPLSLHYPLPTAVLLRDRALGVVVGDAELPAHALAVLVLVARISAARVARRRQAEGGQLLVDALGGRRPISPLAIGRIRAQRLHPSEDAITVRRCRSEEHTSELQSLMRLSSAVFCL